MANNFFGLTDTGRVRGNNEDTFILQASAGGEYIIAAAIDGVGGYSGGEIAASIAKDSIIEYFERSGRDIRTLMAEALIKANEKIYTEKMQVKEHDSMACVLTLAIVDVQNNEFNYIHVGDTRLYLLRDGSLVKLTKDQSFVGFLEDSGRLTEEAAMSHPKRNEINKALGFNTGLESDKDYFETGTSPFLPGDMILLCSDGLTDMLTRQDITKILTSQAALEDMGQQLIDAANARGGRDNITAVLVKNDRPLVKQEAVRPVAVTKKKALMPEPLVTEVENTKETPVDDHTLPVRKSNRTAVTLLTLLSVALLCSTIYLLWLRGSQQSPTGSQVILADTVKNDTESRFTSDLNSFAGDTLVMNDSTYREPIVISSMIELDRDTLYILSRGKILFKRDSLFKGPAFHISGAGKHIVFNGMVFEGFDVALESETKALKLEGVQFLNCRVPVQYQFPVTRDTFMTGTLSEMFFRTDSVSTVTRN